MRYEQHNLDGQGDRRTQVFDLPSLDPQNYWASVTDIPCPVLGCMGTIRWAEEGYVPGYRICDGCGRHFLAKGTAAAPTLLRVAGRRGS
jgi:hypothetical protein